MKIQADKKHLENLPAHAISSLGVNQIAYIKPVEEEGRKAYAVYAADGTQLSIMDDRETAEELISYNNLQQVTVH